MERPLPPRWKRCPRFGSIIADTFIPMKVPLDESYHSLLQPMEYFTPKMFIDTVTNLKRQIGLWIDLSNTSRFYDKTIVERNHIQYFKLKCRGHNEAPSEEQVQTFIQKCSFFLYNNPNMLIAVHCTHGFNRTGFLIASYLVQTKDWDVRAAINEFARARAPGIYKQDYLNELIRIYDDEDAPRVNAPELPDWCDEDSEYQDDDAEVISRPSASSAASSTNGKSGGDEIITSIPGIVQVTSMNQIRNSRTVCSNMCKFGKRGFPGAQPVSLSQENICLLAKERYKVSWKADGTRCLMLILNADECYLFDRDYNVYQVPNLKFLKASDPQTPLVETLLDGELVVDIVKGVRYPRYLIYDIICCDGNDVGKNNFEARLQIIFKQIIFPREEAKKNGTIDRTKEPIGIRIKDFFDLHKTAQLLSPNFQRNLAHETDGLIFQPNEMEYYSGRCDRMLKWKPPIHNSIDFKLRVVREHRPGMLEDYVGQLLVNGLDQPFGTIKVSKTIRELNNKIIECRFNRQKGCWELMRERTDKSYPNAYTTAENVMRTIMHPIEENYLLNFIRQNCRPPPNRNM